MRQTASERHSAKYLTSTLPTLKVIKYKESLTTVTAKRSQRDTATKYSPGWDPGTEKGQWIKNKEI